MDAAGEPFVMHGAREAIDNGLDHIEWQVDTIEECVVSQPAMVFGHAKAIVEAACRKILTERGVAHDDSDNMPSLCKKIRECVPLLPPSASDATKVRKHLVTTLNGLTATLDGITALRNSLDPVAHGSDGPRPQMERTQALLAAQAADTLVGFFYRRHVESTQRAATEQGLFDQSDEFNEWVDETYGPIQIMKSSFSASEVLHRMEPETYRIGAAEFYSQSEERSAPGDD